MVPCGVEVSDKLCYLISKTDSYEIPQWEYLHQIIEGFELEPGYFFHLEVKITTTAGPKASSPPNITYRMNFIKESSLPSNMNLLRDTGTSKTGQVKC
jgi:hypothetical protein